MPSHMNAPALLLSAGRGERMRPLTDDCPKPLLNVRGQPLMRWALQAMARAGVARTLINTAWLGEAIEAELGDGGGDLPALGYSHEGRDFGRALETAGGIARALPALPDVFWVAAGDVLAPQFAFDAQCAAQFAQSQALAHIWLVPNPEHNPSGDFGLDERGRVNSAQGEGDIRLTYSTIGLYRRALFESPWLDIAPGNPKGVAAALAPLLRSAMAQGRVTGAVYTGEWADIGTPERLAAINKDWT
jgi:N-acetyl-alpha-D-muramate 1-phosphate uridylyltransferase